MTSPIPCPDCAKPLDVFTGVVERVLTCANLVTGSPEQPFEFVPVQRTTQVVACSGCTFVDTVANILKEKVS